LTGAIRGYRLAPQVKPKLVGAILQAKKSSFPFIRSCELLMLSPRWLHR
jgi:hypothetical protein